MSSAGVEPGPNRMMLAGLAATYPSQAVACGLLAGLAEFTQRCQRTDPGVALALAAARGDDEATLAQITAIEAWHWQGPLAGGNLLASAGSRALYLLDEMLTAG